MITGKKQHDRKQIKTESAENDELQDKPTWQNTQIKQKMCITDER